MTKPTPGPWRISESGSGYVEPGIDIVSDCPWTVTAVLTDCPHYEANARLIAAAPDLLEAAQKVLAGLHERMKEARDAKEAVPVFDGIADLSDAINKASDR
ncbi:hypothetical protein [Methyloceanibacter caenitepidi]|uniref:Uncharacterized protein n=1 Tax=Methyloceanibacter caenitepidi TaxID=1384459 RepID=A0A0A8K8N1_9HYPH|nr:hypothetical protein [Methyloceanibacter caenitepidi]BAQ18349.1 hypothetical protein GL4_2916 [Methyloceanibacter caenitepidi]